MGQFCKNTVMCEGRDKRIQRAQLACLLVLTVLASLISASELSSAPAATAPFFGEVEVCIKPSSARDPEQPYDITIPTAPTHQSTHGNMATHHHALCPLTKKKNCKILSTQGKPTHATQLERGSSTRTGEPTSQAVSLHPANNSPLIFNAQYNVSHPRYAKTYPLPWPAPHTAPPPSNYIAHTPSPHPQYRLSVSRTSKDTKLHATLSKSHVTKPYCQGSNETLHAHAPQTCTPTTPPAMASQTPHIPKPPHCPMGQTHTKTPKNPGYEHLPGWPPPPSTTPIHNGTSPAHEGPYPNNTPTHTACVYHAASGFTNMAHHHLLCINKTPAPKDAEHNPKPWNKAPKILMLNRTTHLHMHKDEATHSYRPITHTWAAHSSGPLTLIMHDSTVTGSNIPTTCCPHAATLKGYCCRDCCNTYTTSDYELMQMPHHSHQRAITHYHFKLWAISTCQEYQNLAVYIGTPQLSTYPQSINTINKINQQITHHIAAETHLMKVPNMNATTTMRNTSPGTITSPSTINKNCTRHLILTITMVITSTTNRQTAKFVNEICIWIPPCACTLLNETAQNGQDDLNKKTSPLLASTPKAFHLHTPPTSHYYPQMLHIVPPIRGSKGETFSLSSRVKGDPPLFSQLPPPWTTDNLPENYPRLWTQYKTTIRKKPLNGPTLDQTKHADSTALARIFLINGCGPISNRSACSQEVSPPSPCFKLAPTAHHLTNKPTPYCNWHKHTKNTMLEHHTAEPTSHPCLHQQIPDILILPLHRYAPTANVQMNGQGTLIIDKIVVNVADASASRKNSSVTLPADDTVLFHTISEKFLNILMAFTSKDISPRSPTTVGGVHLSFVRAIGTAYYQAAAMFILQAYKCDSPIAKVFVVLNPSTGTVEHGIPHLGLSTGRPCMAHAFPAKVVVITAPESLNAVRPHEQANNIIKEFVMGAFNSSISDLPTPPDNASPAALAVYLNKLTQVVGHEIMQILDVQQTRPLTYKGANALGVKFDERAVILMPNTPALGSALDSSGGSLTLRQQDSKGTTVMEFTLTRLPRTSAGNNETMSDPIALLFTAETSKAHIVLSPLNNTPVTQDQIKGAVQALLYLGHTMAAAAAGPHKAALPVMCIRDSLTNKLSATDMDTPDYSGECPNPFGYSFALTRQCKDTPLSMIPTGQLGNLQSIVVVMDSTDTAAFAIAGLTLLCSGATPRVHKDALSPFGIGIRDSYYTGTPLPMLRPDKLTRQQKSMELTTVLLTAIRVMTGKPPPTTGPPALPSVLAAYRLAATEAANHLTHEAPADHLRPMDIHDPAEMDVMAMLYGPHADDDATMDDPAPRQPPLEEQHVPPPQQQQMPPPGQQQGPPHGQQQVSPLGQKQGPPPSQAQVPPPGQQQVSPLGQQQGPPPSQAQVPPAHGQQQVSPLSQQHDPPPSQAHVPPHGQQQVSLPGQQQEPLPSPMQVLPPGQQHEPPPPGQHQIPSPGGHEEPIHGQQQKQPHSKERQAPPRSNQHASRSSSNKTRSPMLTETVPFPPLDGMENHVHNNDEPPAEVCPPPPLTICPPTHLVDSKGINLMRDHTHYRTYECLINCIPYTRVYSTSHVCHNTHPAKQHTPYINRINPNPMRCCPQCPGHHQQCQQTTGAYPWCTHDGGRQGGIVITPMCDSVSGRTNQDAEYRGQLLGPIPIVPCMTIRAHHSYDEGPITNATHTALHTVPYTPNHRISYITNCLLHITTYHAFYLNNICFEQPCIFKISYTSLMYNHTCTPAHTTNMCPHGHAYAWLVGELPTVDMQMYLISVAPLEGGRGLEEEGPSPPTIAQGTGPDLDWSPKELTAWTLSNADCQTALILQNLVLTMELDYDNVYTPAPALVLCHGLAPRMMFTCLPHYDWIPKQPHLVGQPNVIMVLQPQPVAYSDGGHNKLEKTIIPTCDNNAYIIASSPKGELENENLYLTYCDKESNIYTNIIATATDATLLAHIISNAAISGLYITCAIFPPSSNHCTATTGSCREKYNKKCSQKRTNSKLTASSLRSSYGHHITIESLLLRNLHLDNTLDSLANTQHQASNLNRTLLSKLIRYLTDTCLETPPWLPLLFCPTRIPIMHGDMNYPPCLRGKIRCQAQHRLYRHTMAISALFPPPGCTCLQSWMPYNQLIHRYSHMGHLHDYSADESYKNKCSSKYSAHPADTEESPLPHILKSYKSGNTKEDESTTVVDADTAYTPAADTPPSTSSPGNPPSPPASAHAKEAETHQTAKQEADAKILKTISHMQFIKNYTDHSRTIQAQHIKNSALNIVIGILKPLNTSDPPITPRSPPRTRGQGPDPPENVDTYPNNQCQDNNKPRSPEHAGCTHCNVDHHISNHAPNNNAATPVGGDNIASEPMDMDTWKIPTYHRKKGPPPTPSTRVGHPHTNITYHRICTTHKVKCINAHAANMYHEKQHKQQCQVHAINMMRGEEWLDKDAVLNYCTRQATVNPHWNNYFNCSTGNYTDTVISFIMYHNTNEKYKFKYHGSATDLGDSALQIKNKITSCGSAVLLWAECNALEGLPTYNHSMCLKQCPTDGMWYLLDSENLHGPTILDTPEKWKAIRGQLRTLEPAPTNNTHGIHVDLDSPEQASIRHGTGPHSIFTNIIRENAERCETNPPSKDDVIMTDAPKKTAPATTRVNQDRAPNTHKLPKPKTSIIKSGRITKTATVYNRQPLLPNLLKRKIKNICDYYFRKAVDPVTTPTHMQVDPPITGSHAQAPDGNGVTAKAASQVAPPSKVTNKAPPPPTQDPKYITAVEPQPKGQKKLNS